MKNLISLIIVMSLIQNIITAQNPIQSEKIVSYPINGKQYIISEYVTAGIINDHIKVENKSSKSALIWEAEAEWAICKSVNISDETYHSFIGWQINDEAWAYFNGTGNTPVWAYDIDGAEELPQDLTSDGTYMVGATGNTVYGFNPSSGTPDWEYTISNSGDIIYNIVISDDGETVYFVSGDDYTYSYITSVDILSSEENWNFSIPDGGYAVKLVLSANGERLIIEKYNNTIVYSNNGGVLFDMTRTNGAGAKPAVSDDGNVFVIGDYYGYATVYEYNVISEIYEEKWQYLFEWGDYYDWVNAIAVSGDGSTIALGSTQFEEDGTFTGELAVFDTQSNVPLWIYQSVNDALSAIDISQNGSLIAAVSYGPIDDNDDDFWVFNRNSNEAAFKYTCQGSPYDIDISSDGSKCIVGGKAVHARISGHGGKLYYLDLEQGLDIEILTDLQKNTNITNFPNPFKSKTTITYSLQENSNVIIEIYNIQGKKIKTLVNEYQVSGNHSVVWYGRNETEQSVNSGIYFYRITAGNLFSAKEMILIK